jgi:hypothetical protein
MTVILDEVISFTTVSCIKTASRNQMPFSWAQVMTTCSNQAIVFTFTGYRPTLLFRYVTCLTHLSASAMRLFNYVWIMNLHVNIRQHFTLVRPTGVLMLILHFPFVSGTTTQFPASSRGLSKNKIPSKNKCFHHKLSYHMTTEKWPWKEVYDPITATLDSNPLEPWMNVQDLILACLLYVEALWRAHYLSRETCQTCKVIKFSEMSSELKQARGHKHVKSKKNFPLSF